MNQLEAAQALLNMAPSGQTPTPEAMRALQSASLNALSDAQLTDLGSLLVARLRSPGVKALVGEITPRILVAMLSDASSTAALLDQVKHRQHVVRALLQAVESGTNVSLAVRSAFGLLTSRHTDLLRQAIHGGHLTPDDLLRYVDNGAELTQTLKAQQLPVPLHFETLLDAVGHPQRAASEVGFDSPLEVIGNQGQFTVMASNGYELWRAATFQTQEPETVAWLDDTFGEGDCLYDVGANIGLYALYALAKTHNAQAVCFEPDAVNYYRLSMNIVANGFGARAVLLPVALSDTMELATFNSSLFVAGKAENWISSGTELMGASHPPNPWQHTPVLRTGCPTFDLDGLLAQAPFLPPPTHVKIDVDSVEIAILRGAAHTLHRPILRHLLVELYDRDLDNACAMLSAAGFHHVHCAAQRNVLPCYEEPLCNHIFAKDEPRDTTNDTR